MDAHDSPAAVEHMLLAAVAQVSARKVSGDLGNEPRSFK